MKRIEPWLEEYGQSHQDETNKAIHWICVPAIFFSILALLYSVKLPLFLSGHQVNIALAAVFLVTIYYASLSGTLWIGMLLFGVICLTLFHFIERSGLTPLWVVGIIVFVVAWLGQFYGHKVEGKKPSFVKDLQFLMIGPAWLMSFIYKKLGIGL